MLCSKCFLDFYLDLVFKSIINLYLIIQEYNEEMKCHGIEKALVITSGFISIFSSKIMQVLVVFYLFFISWSRKKCNLRVHLLPFSFVTIVVYIQYLH